MGQVAVLIPSGSAHLYVNHSSWTSARTRLGENAQGECPTPKVGALALRQEKRAQRLTFWVRRPPGRVGVFHTKGWWPKTSCCPSKVCLPWASKRGIWDVPGILPGCPGPLGVFKKFVLKKFVRIFRSLCSGKATALNFGVLS